MDLLKDICRRFKFDENELKWNMLNHAGIVTAENAWQKHSTPDSICNQMINIYKSEFDNQQNILILFNIELIKSIYINYEDVIYKNIYFVADTKEKFNWVQKNFSKINCAYLDFHDINKLNECIKGFNVKKFDVVFSNPPYNGNLDLKILKSLFEQKISNKIVFVHPAGYLLDKKFKTKLYNELRNTNYLESVYMFWGNKLFDIKLFMPCCISVWNTNKTSNECRVNDRAITKTNYSCKVNDISIHGIKFNSVKYFLNNESDNLLNHVQDQEKLSDYSVRFALIRGHSHESDGYCSDFFTLLCEDTNKNKCDSAFRFSEASKFSGNVKSVFSFNNENERINFITYCKSKFVRFLVSLTKTGANITRGELEVIPWMDFTQEWNDAKLCKEFGISEELWNYIDNFIPDYYEDYKSGF